MNEGGQPDGGSEGPAGGAAAGATTEPKAKRKRTVAPSVYILEQQISVGSDGKKKAFATAQNHPTNEDGSFKPFEGTEDAKKWLKTKGTKGEQYRVVRICWAGTVVSEEQVKRKLA